MTDTETTFTPPFAGWATIIYPLEAKPAFRAMLEKQHAGGANFVWIGHNNPGWVEPGKAEPGLSYAVYEEATDPAATYHEEAKRVLRALRDFLEVCREMQIPVVLPMGYQIQMGHAWVARHPDHVRRHADGKVIDWGGVSASFYSPQYREDIIRYYEWVARTIVDPFREIILMVNLADEPFGGDYSAAAEAEFRRLYGYGFGDVGEDIERQRALGRFQSDMIVSYATWSAERWHAVCPDIPSTMSFCGSHGREENLMPTVENLFSKTPPHFEITFDLYPRDGPFDHAITPPDVTALWVFLTQLGGLSRKFNKPLWIWPTGNSWGTGQASSDPGHVSDAVANVYYNVDRIVAAGGRVKGLAIWNYNCNNQGLFNDPHETVYDPEIMFERLSESFSEVRPVMRRSLQAPWEPQPRIALFAPPEPGFLRIGRTRASVCRLEDSETRPYDFSALEAFAHYSKPFVVFGEMEDLPTGCDTLIVLPETIEEIPAALQAALKAWPGEGRTLVVSPALASLFNAPQQSGGPLELGPGTLWIADLGQAFRLESAEGNAPLWHAVFKDSETSPVFHYEVPWRVFGYNLTGFDQPIAEKMDEGDLGTIVDREAAPIVERSGQGVLEGVLSHHSFIRIDRKG